MTDLHDVAVLRGDTSDDDHPRHRRSLVGCFLAEMIGAIGVGAIVVNLHRTTMRRNTDMTDEHVKGTVSKIKGKVEETAGKVTGNKGQELRGKARQVQGSGQQGLGDVQDAMRKPKDRT